MAVAKKRVIKSLENLSEDLRDLLKEQYPNGYEGSITRITNAKREPIFVFHSKRMTRYIWLKCQLLKTAMVVTM
jgi:hypothetical protein